MVNEELRPYNKTVDDIRDIKNGIIYILLTLNLKKKFGKIIVIN